MRISRIAILLFGLAILCISIPKQTVEKLRGGIVELFSPIFSAISLARHGSENKNAEEKNLQLQLDRELMQAELAHIKQLYLHERFINHQANVPNKSHSLGREDFFDSLKKQQESLPARIIFRPADTWYSTLWVDVGQNDNKRLGKTAIAKNSPVLFGTAVVGIVDYVGPSHSKIRLITDGGISIAVRALRGQAPHPFIAGSIDFLAEEARGIRGEILTKVEKETLQSIVQKFKAVSANDELWHLAKGEIRGTGIALNRQRGGMLKGTGFNCDFRDEKGPARDLRTGTAIASFPTTTMPIVRTGDLLVTSGIDGLFPAGLPVACVTEVYSLKEGDYYYDLEARPAAGNLDNLSWVFILPPLDEDAEEILPPW